MSFSNISDVFTDMRTVYVRFDGTPDRQYAYLAHANMGLVQGDLVVVPTKSTFALAHVVTSILGMTDRANRMVVLKVPTEQFKHRERQVHELFDRVSCMKNKLEFLKKNCNVSCLMDSDF